MSVYVLLSKLTAKGLQTLHSKPERLAQLNLELKDLGFGVLHQYALLGEYDFITILEAPDSESVAHLSVDLGSRGTVMVTTLAALSQDSFVSRLQGSAQVGRG